MPNKLFSCVLLSPAPAARLLGCLPPLPAHAQVPPPDTVHLTLNFFGTQDAYMTELRTQQLRGDRGPVIRRYPFPLRLDTVSSFDRPGVVFAAPLDDGSARELYKEACRVFCAIPRPEWTPHVTLAKGLRRGEAARVAELCRQRMEPVDVIVNEVSLIQTVPQKAGPTEYKRITFFPMR